MADMAASFHLVIRVCPARPRQIGGRTTPLQGSCDQAQLPLPLRGGDCQFRLIQSIRQVNGAAKKTRTSTGFRPQRPQRCASTSSATTAKSTRAQERPLRGRSAPLAKPPAPCKRPLHANAQITPSPLRIRPSRSETGLTDRLRKGLIARQPLRHDLPDFLPCPSPCRSLRRALP